MASYCLHFIHNSLFYKNEIIILALLLYTKCRVATAPVTGEARTQVLQSCCDTLDLVKKNFSKIGAQARLLHAWYLQVTGTSNILGFFLMSFYF